MFWTYSSSRANTVASTGMLETKKTAHVTECRKKYILQVCVRACVARVVCWYVPLCMCMCGCVWVCDKKEKKKNRKQISKSPN